MQQGSVWPDSVSFVGLPNACAGLRALEDGRLVHELLFVVGIHIDENVYTYYIYMSSTICHMQL